MRSARVRACGRGHAEAPDCSWGKLTLVSDFLQPIVVRAVVAKSGLRRPSTARRTKRMRHEGPLRGHRESEAAIHRLAKALRLSDLQPPLESHGYLCIGLPECEGITPGGLFAMWFAVRRRGRWRRGSARSRSDGSTSSSIETGAAQIRVIARARLSETPPTRVHHPWRTRDETCASAAGRRSPAAGSDDNLLLLAETNTSNGAKSAPANTSTRANSRTPSPRWARTSPSIRS